MHAGGALGDLVAHGVQADEVLAAEVRRRFLYELPRVGDVGDLGLHRVKQDAGLGDRPAAGRAPASAGWTRGGDRGGVLSGARGRTGVTGGEEVGRRRRLGAGGDRVVQRAPGIGVLHAGEN